MASSNSLELKHTVRYFNSWLEELSPEEIIEEQQKLIRYETKRRLSSINENESDDESA